MAANFTIPAKLIAFDSDEADGLYFKEPTLAWVMGFEIQTSENTATNKKLWELVCDKNGVVLSQKEIDNLPYEYAMRAVNIMRDYIETPLKDLLGSNENIVDVADGGGAEKKGGSPA